MNAEELKQLDLQIKNQLITDNELAWLIVCDGVYGRLRIDTIFQNKETLIDFSEEPYSRIPHLDLTYIKEKLESKGYKVNRDVGDKKKLIISR